MPRGGIKAFLGRTAQDVHLDSHTAPELCTSFRCAKKPLYHIFLFPECVCPVNYRGVLARLFCQNIHVGMSCCCLFPYVSDLKMFFLPPSVCMLQVLRVLRPEPSFARNNGAGATTGTTSSPSCLGLLVSGFGVQFSHLAFFWGQHFPPVQP